MHVTTPACCTARSPTECVWPGRLPTTPEPGSSTRLAARLLPGGNTHLPLCRTHPPAPWGCPPRRWAPCHRRATLHCKRAQPTTTIQWQLLLHCHSCTPPLSTRPQTKCHGQSTQRAAGIAPRSPDLVISAHTKTRVTHHARILLATPNRHTHTHRHAPNPGAKYGGALRWGRLAPQCGFRPHNMAQLQPAPPHPTPAPTPTLPPLHPV